MSIETMPAPSFAPSIEMAAPAPAISASIGSPGFESPALPVSQMGGMNISSNENIFTLPNLKPGVGFNPDRSINLSEGEFANLWQAPQPATPEFSIGKEVVSDLRQKSDALVANPSIFSEIQPANPTDLTNTLEIYSRPKISNPTGIESQISQQQVEAPVSDLLTYTKPFIAENKIFSEVQPKISPSDLEKNTVEIYSRPKSVVEKLMDPAPDRIDTASVSTSHDQVQQIVGEIVSPIQEFTSNIPVESEVDLEPEIPRILEKLQSQPRNAVNEPTITSKAEEQAKRSEKTVDQMIERVDQRREMNEKTTAAKKVGLEIAQAQKVLAVAYELDIKEKQKVVAQVERAVKTHLVKNGIQDIPQIVPDEIDNPRTQAVPDLTPPEPGRFVRDEKTNTNRVEVGTQAIEKVSKTSSDPEGKIHGASVDLGKSDEERDLRSGIIKRKPRKDGSHEEIKEKFGKWKYRTSEEAKKILGRLTEKFTAVKLTDKTYEQPVSTKEVDLVLQDPDSALQIAA